MVPILDRFVSPARRTIDFACNIPFRAAGMCSWACAGRHSSNQTSFQLIRDLGITNGNESQVGYYVGLMVRELKSPVPRAHWPEVTLAIIILFNSGIHCSVLELDVRSPGSKTSHFDWPLWVVTIDVLFWPLEDLLGSCSQVFVLELLYSHGSLFSKTLYPVGAWTARWVRYISFRAFWIDFLTYVLVRWEHRCH